MRKMHFRALTSQNVFPHFFSAGTVTNLGNTITFAFYDPDHNMCIGPGGAPLQKEYLSYITQAHTHIYTHTQTNTYVYTYIYIRVNVFHLRPDHNMCIGLGAPLQKEYLSNTTQAQTHIHIHTGTHKFKVHTYVCIYICKHVYTHTHTNTHTLSLSHSLTHTHTYTHIYTNTYLHTHTHIGA